MAAIREFQSDRDGVDLRSRGRGPDERRFETTCYSALTSPAGFHAACLEEAHVVGRVAPEDGGVRGEAEFARREGAREPGAAA